MNGEALRVYGVKDLEDAHRSLDKVMSRAVYRSPADLQSLCRLRAEDGAVSSALFAVEDVSAGVAEQREREREHRLLDEQTRVISGLSQEFTTVWLISKGGSSSVKYRDAGQEDVARESVFFARQNMDYT